MKKIMAVNAGSSSLKFKLVAMPEEKYIAEGIFERIGSKDAVFKICLVLENGEKKELKKETMAIKNHAQAVSILLEDLVNLNIVKELNEIAGVGHRIVHGGEYFDKSALVDEEVLEKIESLCDLAPLHNPAHLIGIRAFMAVLPDTPSVVVFDTAFHQTMESVAYMYALPYAWYEKYRVRKYGFHGTSHDYVSKRAAVLHKKDVKDLKIVTLHLGNGASLCAVKNGKCVDTSMGLTPLGGIPMGTRSGDIDPAVVEFISIKEKLTAKEIVNILNKGSGYLGISGISNDSRDMEVGIKRGDARCRLALDLQYKRIADFIGSYYVYMGGIDIIVFTAGIGENSKRCRRKIMERLAVLGVKINTEANENSEGETLISANDSNIAVYVIPTNEEIMIARDTMTLINN